MKSICLYVQFDVFVNGQLKERGSFDIEDFETTGTPRETLESLKEITRDQVSSAIKFQSYEVSITNIINLTQVFS